MGFYINPGAENFSKSIKSSIYVDKTELIKYTNKVIDTENMYICVSRPRRFGKTMAMNMLSAYYDCTVDAKIMFNNLKIAGDKSFAEFANKFNVLQITITEFADRKSAVEKIIERLESDVIEDIMDEYPDITFRKTNDLLYAMRMVYKKTGIKFILLIDEWDYIFRVQQGNSSGHEVYLDFLRKLLKDQPHIALVYMTGILPIKKYGEHSALNMFDEFSMEQPKYLSEFVGFTNDEVQDLCKLYSMDYFECKAWYDGYLLKYSEFNHDVEEKWINHTIECYSPWSLTKAMINGQCMDYWTRTETYEALQIYIKLNLDGLKDKIIGLISGDRYKINPNKFKNEMTNFSSSDDVFTLMVHLGYLGYDSKSSEVFIPNQEVREQYATCIEDLEEWRTIAQAIKNSDDLLAATIAGDNEKVAQLIENAHVETSYLQYNDENALSYTISLAYFTARRKYNIRREFPTGKGFADLVLLPLPHHQEMPPMIVELKWDKTAQTAIDQIKNKEYTEALKPYKGRILLVGINYSKTTKKHTCKIEKA